MCLAVVRASRMVEYCTFTRQWIGTVSHGASCSSSLVGSAVVILPLLLHHTFVLSV